MATKFKVRVTFTEDLLGAQSANPDLLKDGVIRKSADADKAKEEQAATPVGELLEKSVTVFHRDNDGQPMLFDYQVKGFLKEALGILIATPEHSAEIVVGKSTKLSKYTHKKVVDNYIFVYPRRIRLSNQVDEEACTRPLRADTQQGERIALASSEVVPPATTAEFEIETLLPPLEPLVRACLDYGIRKGMGQWRNSGKGRFTWEEVK